MSDRADGTAIQLVVCFVVGFWVFELGWVGSTKVRLALGWVWLSILSFLFF